VAGKQRGNCLQPANRDLEQAKRSRLEEHSLFYQVLALWFTSSRKYCLSWMCYGDDSCVNRAWQARASDSILQSSRCMGFCVACQHHMLAAQSWIIHSSYWRNRSWTPCTQTTQRSRDRIGATAYHHSCRVHCEDPTFYVDDWPSSGESFHRRGSLRAVENLTTLQVRACVRGGWWQSQIYRTGISGTPMGREQVVRERAYSVQSLQRKLVFRLICS